MEWKRDHLKYIFKAHIQDNVQCSWPEFIGSYLHGYIFLNWSSRWVSVNCNSNSNDLKFLKHFHIILLMFHILNIKLFDLNAMLLDMCKSSCQFSAHKPFSTSITLIILDCCPALRSCFLDKKNVRHEKNYYYVMPFCNHIFNRMHNTRPILKNFLCLNIPWGKHTVFSLKSKLSQKTQ